MLRHALAKQLICITALAGATACGARTKSASQVEGIFNQNNQSLGFLMVDLCQKLRNRQEAPNMSKTSISDSECNAAGKNADNYKSVKKAFTFEGLTNEVNKTDGHDVLHIRTRAKVWLNQNILDLALKLTKALKERANGGADIFSKPPKNGGGDQLEKLITVKTTELKKIEMDQQTKTFSGKLNLTGSGLVKLNNDIEIAGQLFSDSVGINISSSQQVDFKESLIRDVNAVGIVKPFDNDVYVDLVFELNIHSIGLNGLLYDKINSALGSSLKMILDTLLKLE